LIPMQKAPILAANVGEELCLPDTQCSRNSGILGSLPTKVAITKLPFIYVWGISWETSYPNFSVAAIGDSVTFSCCPSLRYRRLANALFWHLVSDVILNQVQFEYRK